MKFDQNSRQKTDEYKVFVYSVVLTWLIIYPFISLQFKYKMSNNHRFRLSNIVAIYFLALYLAGRTEQKCEFNNFFKKWRIWTVILGFILKKWFLSDPKVILKNVFDLMDDNYNKREDFVPHKIGSFVP